jgi:hypothetical protein
MSHGYDTAIRVGRGSSGQVAIRGISSETTLDRFSTLTLMSTSKAYFHVCSMFFHVCSVAQVQEFGGCSQRTQKHGGQQDTVGCWNKKKSIVLGIPSAKLQDTCDQEDKFVLFGQVLSRGWLAQTPHRRATFFSQIFAPSRIIKAMEQGDKMSAQSFYYML